MQKLKKGCLEIISRAAPGLGLGEVDAIKNYFSQL